MTEHAPGYTPPTRAAFEADAAAHKLARLREATQGTEALDGPGLIAHAVRHTQGQGDLARLSGIAPNTITAIKRGKRPTAAHRAAILWAIIRSLGF